MMYRAMGKGINRCGWIGNEDDDGWGGSNTILPHTHPPSIIHPSTSWHHTYTYIVYPHQCFHWMKTTSWVLGNGVKYLLLPIVPQPASNTLLVLYHYPYRCLINRTVIWKQGREGGMTVRWIMMNVDQIGPFQPNPATDRFILLLKRQQSVLL